MAMDTHIHTYIHTHTERERERERRTFAEHVFESVGNLTALESLAAPEVIPECSGAFHLHTHIHTLVDIIYTHEIRYT